MNQLVKIFKANKMVVVLIVILVLAGVALYSFILRQLPGITDQEFGFKIANIQGWQKIEPRGGAHLSLATGKEGVIVSYADIRPVKKIFSLPLDEEKRQLMIRLCDEVKGRYNYQNELFEPLEIGGLTAFKCSFEIEAVDSSQMQVFSQYILINPNDQSYDYVISTTFPKDSPYERNKVRDLIESFSAL